MSEKKTKTTGFAIDRELLLDFQQYLERAHDIGMAPVLVGWITRFMSLPESERGRFLALPPKELIGLNVKPSQVSIPDEGEIGYNPDTGEWLGIARSLLEHQNPGLADLLRRTLMQLNDLARLWDGLQITPTSTTRTDQPAGDESRSEGLGALDAATARLRRDLRDFERSREKPHGKKGRSGKENSSGG